MLESRYQAQLIKKLQAMFEGCVILKNDSSYLQGVPDLTILYKDRWAMLEVKATGAWVREQPNQEHWIRMLDDMSFAAFIHPGNEEEVLDALQHTFWDIRYPRVS